MQYVLSFSSSLSRPQDNSLLSVLKTKMEEDKKVSSRDPDTENKLVVIINVPSGCQTEDCAINPDGTVLTVTCKENIYSLSAEVIQTAVMQSGMVPMGCEARSNIRMNEHKLAEIQHQKLHSGSSKTFKFEVDLIRVVDTDPSTTYVCRLVIDPNPTIGQRFQYVVTYVEMLIPDGDDQGKEAPTIDVGDNFEFVGGVSDAKPPPAAAAAAAAAAEPADYEMHDASSTSQYSSFAQQQQQQQNQQQQNQQQQNQHQQYQQYQHQHQHQHQQQQQQQNVGQQQKEGNLKDVDREAEIAETFRKLQNDAAYFRSLAQESEKERNYIANQLKDEQVSISFVFYQLDHSFSCHHYFY
jgi:hypothetical protein